MAHGFRCTACGQCETDHAYPDEGTCGRYQSPDAGLEVQLWDGQRSQFPITGYLAAHRRMSLSAGQRES